MSSLPDIEAFNTASFAWSKKRLLKTSWIKYYDANPENEEKVLAASRKIVDGVKAVTKKNGIYLDFKYSNYSSRDQNPLASYGAEGLQKLISIAKSYYPEDVFQTLQNGGWLVSKAV
ncbi:FAD-binding type 2 [Penicillium hetheringtonii]|uniref:FAD-binding type 2 n=1 Tax=Penicillium hetheringtonii TaxID=911720 RepID=A0AAD6D9A7_9EURO|nr:FAD-binding type 2 [Penicillium hetheringtonii]